MNHEHRHEPDDGEKTISRAKWVFIGFAAIAAYFLIAEHKAHHCPIITAITTGDPAA